MDRTLIIFFLSLIYLSVVSGILFKFFLYGVRGYQLLLSLILPLLLFTSSMGFGIQKLRKIKGIRRKFSGLFYWIYITFSCFPVVVGLCARNLSTISEKARSKRKHGNKTQKNIMTLKSLWSSCFSYYSNHEKDFQKLRLA